MQRAQGILKPPTETPFFQEKSNKLQSENESTYSIPKMYAAANN